MNLDQLTTLVARITYKPNATLYVDKSMRQLRIAFHVQDTLNNDPSKIHISMSYPIPHDGWFRSEADALDWILLCLRNIEDHETREWLKLDGVVIFNPHKEIL